MRSIALLSLLAVGVAAQDEPFEGPKADDVVIEEAAPDPDTGGRIARGAPDAPVVPVRLGGDGTVRVQRDGAWTDVTLAELMVALRAAHDAHRERMKGEGKEGDVLLPGGVKASPLFLSIEADAKAPWRHFIWLLTIAAESKTFKIQFGDGERSVLVRLPVDRGIRPTDVEPSPVVKSRVHVVWRDEGPARFKVLDPETGEDVELADVAALRAHLAAVKKGAGETPVVGELKAADKAPFARILDAMEALVDAKLDRFEMAGGAVPTTEQRDLKKLPFPE